MALFVPGRYVECRGNQAVVRLPWRCEETYTVWNGGIEGKRMGFYVDRKGKVIYGGSYGLKGGGALCSKNKPKSGLPKTIPSSLPPPPIISSSNTTSDKCSQGTSMTPSDSEAHQGFLDLSTAIHILDYPGVYQNACILLQNSAEMDGQIVELLVPTLGSGSVWNVGDVMGDITRQTLALLLRVATVRHAIRSNERPGFRYEHKNYYAKELERVIRKIEKEKKETQDVDFQAEIRASWAVVSTIEDDEHVWDTLRRVIPKIAKLVALVDPIRYAGTLTEGIIDVSTLLYDQYQHLKESTLSTSVITLTILYSLRHNISPSEVQVLSEIHRKCNRWGIAVLLIRLLALILEEGVIKTDISFSIFELLEELSGFKKFVFRNNWKVRKAALYALMRLNTCIIQSQELKKMIDDALDMRLLLETDSNVLAIVRHSSRLERARGKLQEKAFRGRMDRQVEEIHTYVTGMYASQHAKDEGRIGVVAEELRTATEAMKKVLDLASPDVSSRTAELQEAVHILNTRSQEMSDRLELIKTTIDQAALPIKFRDHIRNLPQRNLENGFFVGREEELSRLLSEFRLPNAKSVIFGESGIGKSYLALKFAYEAEKAGLFSNYIWLHASKSSTLFQDYLEIAVNLNISHGNDTEKVLYIKSHLKHNSRTLLIYDNADFEDCMETDSEIDQFIRENFIFDQASVLITSRNEEEWRDRVTSQVHLRRLTGKEGVKLLETISELQEGVIDEELVEKLDGNPLALRTAGKYLRQSKSKNTLMGKLNRRQGPGFDRLLDVCVDTVTPQARMTLEACSYLNSDNIDSRLTDKLLKNAKLHQQYTTISELESLNLLETTNGHLEMHRMTQNSAYALCKNKEEREMQIGKCLREMISTDMRFDPDLMLNARFYHDKRVVNSEDNRKVDRELIEYLISRRLGREAKRLADSIGEPDTASEAETLLALLQNAEIASNLGLHSDAELYYKQAYDLSKNYPEKLFQVAWNLARYQFEKGEMEMAKAYMEKVVNTLDSVSLLPKQLAEIYLLAGKLNLKDENVEKPKEFLLKALEIGGNKAEIYVTLAEMYFKHIGLEADAINSLEFALNSLKSTPTDPLHAKIYRLLANNTRFDPEKPYFYLNEEVKFRHLHLLDDKKGLIEGLIELGKMLLLKNRNQEAILTMKEAENLVDLAENRDLVREIYEILAKAAVASGDNETALHYNNLKDQLQPAT